MKENLTYAKLVEVYGRLEADLLESYLEAQGIDVELIQESIGRSIYPVTVDGLGRVQVFVPKEKLGEAKALLEQYSKDQAS
jgi:hypothetical protein